MCMSIPVALILSPIWAFRYRGVDVLHIILIILKIIGFILLGILALVLAVSLILLFVPLKYEFSGGRHDSMEMTGRIRWLFGILRIEAFLKNSDFRARASFLWFRVFDTQKEVSEDEAENFSEEILDNLETNGNKILKDIPEQKVSDKTEVPVIKEPCEEPEPKKTDRPSTLSAQLAVEEKSSEQQKIKMKKDAGAKRKKKFRKENQDRQGPIQRISAFFENRFRAVSKKMEALYCQYEKLERKKEWLETFWNAEFTRNSIVFGKKALLSVLKHIRPKRLSGKIHFGLEKPSDTGKILGYSSMLYAWYGNHLELLPDFEQAVFEGDIYFKGAVRIYIFLYWGIRGLLNKDIRKFIKYIKHFKNREETTWQ